MNELDDFVFFRIQVDAVRHGIAFPLQQSNHVVLQPPGTLPLGGFPQQSVASTGNSQRSIAGLGRKSWTHGGRMRLGETVFLGGGV